MQGLGVARSPCSERRLFKTSGLKSTFRQGDRCLALTEPKSGSDIANIALDAARDGDEFVLNSEKTWISNGALPISVASLRAGEAPGAKGLSTVIPADIPGFEIAERLHAIARIRWPD